MKKYLFLSLLLLALWSCGDDEPETAPITTELVELIIPVSASDYFDGGTENVLDITADINLALEGFQTIIASVSEYRVNFVGLTISSVQAGNTAPEVVYADMGIGESSSFSIPPNLIREDKRIDSETPFIGVLTDGSGALTNVNSIPIYNRLEGEQSIIDGTNEGLDVILQQFIANEELTTRVRMGINGDPASFTMIVQFNLSVR